MLTPASFTLPAVEGGVFVGHAVTLAVVAVVMAEVTPVVEILVVVADVALVVLVVVNLDVVVPAAVVVLVKPNG